MAKNKKDKNEKIIIQDMTKVMEQKLNGYYLGKG